MNSATIKALVEIFSCDQSLPFKSLQKYCNKLRGVSTSSSLIRTISFHFYLFSTLLINIWLSQWVIVQSYHKDVFRPSIVQTLRSTNWAMLIIWVSGILVISVVSTVNRALWTMKRMKPRRPVDRTPAHFCGTVRLVPLNEYPLGHFLETITWSLIPADAYFS